VLKRYPGGESTDLREKMVKAVAVLGGRVPETASVDSVRYWEGRNSVRVVVEVRGK